MKQRDKLQNSLRKHYDNMQFPFNEGEWEKAAALINKGQRSKKMYFSVAALLLLGGVIAWYLYISAPSVDSNKNNSKVEIAQFPQVILQNSLGAKKETALKQNKEHFNRKLHKTESNVGNKTKFTLPGAGLIAEKNFQRSEKQVVESNHSSVKSESSPQTIGFAEVALVDQDPPAIQNIVPSNTPVTVYREEIPNAPIEAVGNLAGHSTQGTSGTNSPSGSADRTANNETATVNAPVSFNLGDSNPVVNIPENARRDTLFKSNGSVLTDVSFINVSASKDSLTSEKTNELSDSVKSLMPVPTNNKEGLYTEAGANWLYGWNNSSVMEARGFNATAGITYMSQLSERISFSFGLLYYGIRNLSSSTKISKVTTFKYGENSQVTAISPSALYYLDLPLRFHYYFDEKNSAGAAVNLAYLMNVDAKVKTYEEMPGGQQNIKTYNQSGYMQGFSWYDARIGLLYRRKLLDQVYLHSEIFFGITDIKNDSFFEISGKERNSGFRLCLVYHMQHNKIK